MTAKFTYHGQQDSFFDYSRISISLSVSVQRDDIPEATDSEVRAAIKEAER